MANFATFNICYQCEYGKVEEGNEQVEALRTIASETVTVDLM
jgi:hypothetical protein